MSKAILVMDMPKSCCSCPLCNSSDECIVQDEDANFKASDSWEELRKGCPLRELPQKKEATQLSISPLLPKQYTAFEKGYNACIDEIVKGGEIDG